MAIPYQGTHSLSTPGKKYQFLFNYAKQIYQTMKNNNYVGYAADD
jgi:hypothetical protein